MGEKGKVDYLALICFSQAGLCLEVYKDRWQIETMFRAFKSAGFNLEGTHINDYGRLDKLIKVLSIAFIWAYNVGIFLHHQVRPIPVKKHGRRQTSLFVYGLDNLTEALINNIEDQVNKAFELFLSCT